DYSPRVCRNYCCTAVALAIGTEAASGLLHPRLSDVAVAEDSRLRCRASVRGRRAARDPDEHGSHQGARARARPYRRRETATRGAFADSPALLEILQRSGSPNVALLWDAHHTFVSGKEQPEDTVRQLGRYIRHTHLKDSVPAGNDRRYVLTGTGEVPVKRQIAA